MLGSLAISSVGGVRQESASVPVSWVWETGVFLLACFFSTEEKLAKNFADQEQKKAKKRAGKTPKGATPAMLWVELEPH